MPDSIRIPCEGSGCPVHPIDDACGLCSMCGVRVYSDETGRAVTHKRTDLLAMIERGDFDA